MIIKLLYIVLIFFGVRLVLNKLLSQSSPSRPIKKQKKSDDIIDAEYKVMDE